MKELGFEGKWREWRNSPGGRDSFIDAVAKGIFTEPWRFGFIDADGAADALIVHRQRIASLLDHYEEAGSSFDAYVATSIRFIAKSRRRFARRRHEREYVSERAISFSTAPEGEWVETPTPEYTAEACSRPAHSDTRRHRRAKDSRLLFLFLKCAWEAGDHEIAEVARRTGSPPEELSESLRQARAYLEKERMRYERLSLRRDRAWARLRIVEARSSDILDAGHREAYEPLVEGARTEHERALAALARFKPLVPNSVIARILGVPKGSVDSGLHFLKRDAAAGTAGAAAGTAGAPPISACGTLARQDTFPPWNSLSPPETLINSSNLPPSSPAMCSGGPPTSAIPASMSSKTVTATSRTPSSRPRPSSP